MEKSKKVSLFSKITDREDALALVKDCAKAFLFVGVLSLVIALILAPNLILDGILYIALGGLLWRFNSRIIAVLLLLLSSLNVIVTLINLLGLAEGFGGTNIFLAAIVFIAAVRAVEATFKLATTFKEDTV